MWHTHSLNLTRRYACLSLGMKQLCISECAVRIAVFRSHKKAGPPQRMYAAFRQPSAAETTKIFFLSAVLTCAPKAVKFGNSPGRMQLRPGAPRGWNRFITPKSIVSNRTGAPQNALVDAGIRFSCCHHGCLILLRLSV